MLSKAAQLIGTHSGKFHCDESFACFMLKQLPQFKDHQIIRTRDPAKLEVCDVVVDVGAIYDHEKKRYDHHQKGFYETMKTLGKLNFDTKLSSAGLVYAHYGKEVIQEILGNEPIEPTTIDVFYRRLYEQFVESIDAIDNGISQYDGVPKYHSPGNLSSRTERFNAHWNEKNVNDDERFNQAMEFVGGEFIQSVKYVANVWWPARELIEKAIDSRFDVDSSGRIIILENGVCPWKEHFFEIEAERNLADDRITYILYEDSSNQSWRVQAIPTGRNGGFENRLPLPEKWRGLRDNDLTEETGINGGIFVHMTGFIGGNQTREGAIQMAQKALKMEGNDELNEKDVKRIKVDENT